MIWTPVASLVHLPLGATSHFSPATLAPLLFLEDTKRVPASGPLHLLFPVLRILFSQLFSLLFSSISFRCLLESYLLNESFRDSSKMTNHEYHYSWHSLFLFLALQELLSLSPKENVSLVTIKICICLVYYLLYFQCLELCLVLRNLTSVD